MNRKKSQIYLLLLYNFYYYFDEIIYIERRETVL